jgi:hypothetical protein
MRFTSKVWPLVVFPCAAIAACSGGNNNSSDAGTTQTDGGAPIAAGGTGAFGIVVIGGMQKMYLPQKPDALTGKAYVAVVNVGAAGNGVAGAPALIKKVDLGTGGDAGLDAFTVPYATATGGDSSMVIAVSTEFPVVWFIDPNTDTLVKTLTLDSSYGRSSFSGGGGYITGVAVDSAHHRAILSVWNGFALVDLTNQSVTSLIQAPPSENFGFDSVHQRILAPFYDCSSSSVTDPDSGLSTPPSSCNTPMTPDDTGTVIAEGLSVIDLNDNNTVYTYEAPPLAADAAPSYETSPATPVGGEPDSAAVDPTTGVVVVPSELGGFQNVIDLSQATFDKSTRTVTAPSKLVPNVPMTGVAVEFNKHLAFFESEHTQDVGVFDLNAANAGSTAWVHGLMPELPVATVDGGATVSGVPLDDGGGAAVTGSSFYNLGDPHGIAVTTSLTSAGPVGFVVNGNLDWVARVDLAGMLAKASSDGGETQLTEVDMAPFVTYLDATH